MIDNFTQPVIIKVAPSLALITGGDLPADGATDTAQTTFPSLGSSSLTHSPSQANTITRSQDHCSGS